MSDWINQYREQQNAEEERSKDFIKATLEKINNLYPELKELRLNYSGYGDSGEFNGWDHHEPVVDDDLLNVLEENSYRLLPSGWEVNEGSEGAIIFDIKNNKIRIDHNWKVTSHDYDPREMDL